MQGQKTRGGLLAPLHFALPCLLCPIKKQHIDLEVSMTNNLLALMKYHVKFHKKT